VRRLASVFLQLVWLAGLLAGPGLAQEGPRELCARFQGFDLNGDGIAEIERLGCLTEPGERPEAASTVLVLVEGRLLGDRFDPAGGLGSSLSQWCADLAAENWHPWLVRADLYRGPRHQDGRTVLALREFFRAVKQADPSFAGVLLVGSFPAAYLVRNCNWRKHEPLTLNRGRPDERVFQEPVDYLRTMPEIVAQTCDLILADLDGRWEDLYAEKRERLPVVLGAFPGGVPEAGGVTTDFERGTVEFEDFFLVNDGRLDVREVLGPEGRVEALHLVPLDGAADQECSPDDLLRGNRIARPDLLIARINARGVALSPRADLLDANGRPRRVEFEAAEDVPGWSQEIWQADPALELRLLAEFFARNHDYRTGSRPVTFRPASIAHSLGSGYRVMERASSDWVDCDPEHLDISGTPDLSGLVDWLARPAVLRTVRAHSDPWGAVFGRPDVARLEQSAGAELWSWTPEGTALVPSLAAACGGGKLDFFLLQTLWRNRPPGAGASFYVHTGCDAISPPGAGSLPYSAEGYGVRNGAEALLFFADGLALIGRAKVFYDEPRGFAECLQDGGTFGDAWAQYFEVESKAGSWSEVGGDIGRKRTYFWSLLGDWTLRLHP